LGGEKVSEMKRREDEILLIPKNICVDGKEGEEIKLVSFFQKFRVTLNLHSQFYTSLNTYQIEHDPSTAGI
jgi:hypothetical protein